MKISNDKPHRPWHLSINIVNGGSNLRNAEFQAEHHHNKSSVWAHSISNAVGHDWKCSINTGNNGKDEPCIFEQRDINTNTEKEPNAERYLMDLNLECASRKWIKASSRRSDKGFEESILALGKEDQLIDHGELNALSGADVGRIAPRYFPKRPRALSAVQKELAGLREVHNGQAAIELTSDRDQGWKRNRRLYIMTATRRNSTSEFKAIFAMRGDTISEHDTAFASAPTACRGSVPMLLTWTVVFNLSVFMVDISQAFLQAGDLSLPDKMVTTVPPYAILHDPDHLPRCVDSGMPLAVSKDIKVLSLNEYQSPPMGKKKSRFRRCLIARRPLYGGRDAPLRWFLRLASALRKGVVEILGAMFAHSLDISEILATR